MIKCPKDRQKRKIREYYFSVLRTVAPYIQIGLTIYLIWRVK